MRQLADPFPSFLVRGAAWTPSVEVREQGAAVTPSGGTWSLINDAGTVLAGGNVTAAAVTTYAIAAVDWAGTETYGGGYTERWALTFASGGDQTFDRECFVVPVRPYLPITDTDLSDIHAGILSLAPSTDTGWGDKLRATERVLFARLLNQGVLPHQVTSWYAFATWARLYCLHLIADNLASVERGEGKWTRLAGEYLTRADAEWGRITFGRDADGDGVADTDAKLELVPGVYRTPGPTQMRNW